MHWPQGKYYILTTCPVHHTPQPSSLTPPQSTDSDGWTESEAQRFEREVNLRNDSRICNQHIKTKLSQPSRIHYQFAALATESKIILNLLTHSLKVIIDLFLLAHHFKAYDNYDLCNCHILRTLFTNIHSTISALQELHDNNQSYSITLRANQVQNNQSVDARSHIGSQGTFFCFHQ